MVKHIWCNGADNIMAKRWNGEMVILILIRFLLLGPLQQWGPIPLLWFIGYSILHLDKSCLWTMKCLLCKFLVRSFDALLCCTLPPVFVQYISPFTSSYHLQKLGGLFLFGTFFYLAIARCSCNVEISSCQEFNTIVISTYPIWTFL